MDAAKLPQPAPGTSRRTQRNARLAADRREKLMLMAVLTLLAAVSGAGAYLLLLGIRS